MEQKSIELLSLLKIKSNLKVIESSDPLDVISDVSAEHDLLVLGSPEKDSWIDILLGGGRDKFTERSACSVLRLTIKN